LEVLANTVCGRFFVSQNRDQNNNKTNIREKEENFSRNRPKEAHMLKIIRCKRNHFARAAGVSLLIFAISFGVLLWLKPHFANAASTPCTASDFTTLQSCVNSATIGNETDITITANIDMTAMLTIPTGATVAISSASGQTYILARDINYTGRFFLVTDAAGVLTLSNIILDGDSTNTGNTNSFIQDYRGTVNLNTGTILRDNNYNAIGVQRSGAVLNMDGAQILNNTLYTYSSVNNFGLGGAAIELIDGGSATLTSGVIANNTACGLGGGISAYKSVANSVVVTGDLNIGTVSFQNNAATDNLPGCSSTNGYQGGAIYMNSGVTYNMNIDGATFADNTITGGNGGAMFIGTLTTADISATFTGNVANYTGNTAEQNGGAIYVTQTADGLRQPVAITNSTFTSNTAAGNGGAIAIAYANLGSLTVDSTTTFSSNSASTQQYILPSDQAMYDANIFATTWSDGLSNGYNNYDIQYTNGALISFNTNGGSPVASQQIATGEPMTPPTDPTRDSYTFAGWYTDSTLTTPFDFTTPIGPNMTLFAKWIVDSPTEPTVPEAPNTGFAR